MSIFSNVTETDLTNLRKLAEQQKEQQAPKKNKILKQTHDIKLAETLSPITKKLDEVNKSTQKVGDIFKESTQNIGNVIKENNIPQLAIEITPTLHQPIENTPTNQPKENNEGVIYDVELENTLENMRDNIGFFKNLSRSSTWLDVEWLSS